MLLAQVQRAHGLLLLRVTEVLVERMFSDRFSARESVSEVIHVQLFESSRRAKQTARKVHPTTDSFLLRVKQVSNQCGRSGHGSWGPSLRREG